MNTRHSVRYKDLIIEYWFEQDILQYSYDEQLAEEYELAENAINELIWEDYGLRVIDAISDSTAAIGAYIEDTRL